MGFQKQLLSRFYLNSCVRGAVLNLFRTPKEKPKSFDILGREKKSIIVISLTDGTILLWIVLPLRNYNMNIFVEWVETKGQYLNSPWINSSCCVKPSHFAHFPSSCSCNQQCFKSQSRATQKTTTKKQQLSSKKNKTNIKWNSSLES